MSLFTELILVQRDHGRTQHIKPIYIYIYNISIAREVTKELEVSNPGPRV